MKNFYEVFHTFIPWTENNNLIPAINSYDPLIVIYIYIIYVYIQSQFIQLIQFKLTQLNESKEVSGKSFIMCENIYIYTKSVGTNWTLCYPLTSLQLEYIPLWYIYSANWFNWFN